MSMLRAAQRVQHLCIVAAQTRAYKVCIVDPRTVLTDPEAALQGSGAVTIDVPDAFVDKLSAGELSLGEADDPENSWVFGRKGELFEMTYVGSVDASSGFTSIVPASAVERLHDDQASRPSWDEVKMLLSSHDVEWPHENHPFLFVGHIIEADTASVFQRRTGKDIDGLQITSNA